MQSIDLIETLVTEIEEIEYDNIIKQYEND